MRRLDRATFIVMCIIAGWAICTILYTWTGADPADPFVPSIEIPAENRTLLDDLPDKRCGELVDEIIFYNPRLRQRTVEDVADSILTASDVNALTHRDKTILMSIESRWALEINDDNKNNWRTL